MAGVNDTIVARVRSIFPDNIVVKEASDDSILKAYTALNVCYPRTPEGNMLWERFPELLSDKKRSSVWAKHKNTA